MAIVKFVVVFVLTTLVVDAFAATVVRKQRSATDKDVQKTTDTEQVTEICQTNSPCGWAVYKPFTRSIDFFIKNKCLCPEGKKCVRVDDDLSISAYVYRCREEVTNSDAK